jgi:hypothetical protein
MITVTVKPDSGGVYHVSLNANANKFGPKVARRATYITGRPAFVFYDDIVYRVAVNSVRRVKTERV